MHNLKCEYFDCLIFFHYYYPEKERAMYKYWAALVHFYQTFIDVQDLFFIKHIKETYYNSTHSTSAEAGLCARL